MLNAPLSHPKPTNLEDLPQRHENFIPEQKKKAVSTFYLEKTTVFVFYFILSKKILCLHCKFPNKQKLGEG